jgi:hypothetical protein
LGKPKPEYIKSLDNILFGFGLSKLGKKVYFELSWNFKIISPADPHSNNQKIYNFSIFSAHEVCIMGRYPFGLTESTSPVTAPVTENKKPGSPAFLFYPVPEIRSFYIQQIPVYLIPDRNIPGKKPVDDLNLRQYVIFQ